MLRALIFSTELCTSTHGRPVFLAHTCSPAFLSFSLVAPIQSLLLTSSHFPDLLNFILKMKAQSFDLFCNYTHSHADLIQPHDLSTISTLMTPKLIFLAGHLPPAPKLYVHILIQHLYSGANKHLKFTHVRLHFN